MIFVNEMMRFTIVEKPYSKGNTVAINSAKPLKNKCSWICHNNTSYCKENHVKYLQPYFKQVDPFYFGLIGGMKNTGDYVFANIIFLAVLIPFLIYFLFLRILNLQSEIKRFKK